MLFIDGITVQNLILRDQAARTFGEEHLVAELDRRLHLAPLDEIGMRLKNRIELLGRRNLLAIEHTATRLIDHTGPQIAKVLNLLARLRDRQFGDHVYPARFTGLPERSSRAIDNLLGDADEFAVSPGLLLLALP
jgi:hypothetical protein